MTPQQIIEGVTGKLGESQPTYLPGELEATRQVIEAGGAYGYGNLIAWLACAWAVHLRDKHGMREEHAIQVVSNRSPYPLPPPVTG